MFSIKSHIEVHPGSDVHASTKEPKAGDGGDSTTTSPASVTSSGAAGFPTSAATGKPTGLLGRFSAPSKDLESFATGLKSGDLSSMHKQYKEIYANEDGSQYAMVQHQVYLVKQSAGNSNRAYVLVPGTRERTIFVLEFGKGNAWQIEQTPRLLGGGPVHSLLHSQAELENRALAQSVYVEVKEAYRAGHKSNNKFYLRGSKAEDSRRRAAVANRAIGEIRAQFSANIRSGVVVPPSDELVIPAGNCGELARIAAKRTIEKGGYAEVWKFDDDADHAFAVIGHSPKNTSRSFSSWKDVWIVDPWANIVCPAPKYIDKLIKKMEKWERSGKIITGENGQPDSPTDEYWIASLKNGWKERKEAPSPQQPNPWQGFPSS